MRIITISREFGSGGRELGKRLAEIMGFDYYDREIITAIADSSGLDANYVENALETGIWQRVPLTFHNSFASKAVFQASHINLLSEQTKVIEGIAKAGHDCVIVGRNADVLLAKENPFTIFVCADLEAKVRRCMERAPENEQLRAEAAQGLSERLMNRSANRGECAQMCRMAYDLLDANGNEILDDNRRPVHQRYVLSLKDLDYLQTQ